MSTSSRARFRDHRGGRAGAALALAVVALAALGPFVASAPDVTDYAHQLAAPASGHWLGTDLAGRDQLARTFAGARTSLEAAVIVFALTATIGMAVGAFAGFVGGVVDAVLSRVIDVLLGVPSLIVALAVVGALGVGTANLVLAVVVSGWAHPARITRGLVLAADTRLDVVAARMAGIGRARTLAGHVVPGTISSVLVASTATIGEIVLALAGLSFLGLGAQPPAAELGQMLAESQRSLAIAPWLAIGPGVVVVATVAAAMLISDALRDVSTPRAPARHPTRRRTVRARSTPSAPALGAACRIDDLRVGYPDGTIAVRGVSLTVADGECVAVVGESGSGKTTIARAVLGLLPAGTVVDGAIEIAGTDVVGLSARDQRTIRGRQVGYVAQDPYAACDPLRRVGHHVTEAWRAHGRRPGPGEVVRRIAGLGVADADARLRERPHRWSGGMLQRATIVAATAQQPMLTVADEPTSALDADLADDVLVEVRTASRSVLLISHDLRLVARHSDRIAVMYAGRVVETGTTAAVMERPRHPYTQALLAATACPGAPAALMANESSACPFAPRCPDARDTCLVEEPVLIDGVACLLVRDGART